MQWEMFKSVLLEFGIPSSRLESYYCLFEEYSAKVSLDAVDTVSTLKEMRFYVAEVFGQYIHHMQVHDTNETISRPQRYEALKQQQQTEQLPESIAEVDLSQFSLEDLQEELEAMSEYRKVLQAEIKKRKGGK